MGSIYLISIWYVEHEQRSKKGNKNLY